MDKLKKAREWLRLAEMDLDAAEYLLNMRPVPVEIVCYHCQQYVAFRRGIHLS